jgi:hypothetical protein
VTLSRVSLFERHCTLSCYDVTGAIEPCDRPPLIVRTSYDMRD